MNNEKYISMLSESIRLRLRLCLLNLVNDLTLAPENTPVPKELSELETRVKTVLPLLSEGLKTSDSDRTELVNRLPELKTDILKVCTPVYSLMNTCFLLQDMIIWEEKKKAFMAEPLTDMSAEDISEIFHDFLHELHGYELENVLSDVMGSLPCRMTKGVFSDYAKASLEALAKDDADTDSITDSIRYIKSKTLPFTDEKAKALFPEYFNRFDELLAKKLSDLSSEELEKTEKELTDMSQSIFELTDYASMLYNDINYVVALTTLGYDLDFVTDDNIVIKDLFYSAVELNQKASLDEIDKELMEKTNEQSADLIEEDTETLNKSDKKIIAELDTIFRNTSEDKELESCYRAYSQSMAYYVGEAESAINARLEGRPLLTPEDYINSFEAATEALPAYTRKQLRRIFMYFSKCPYDVHQVTDYAGNCLKYYEGKQEFNFITGSLGEILYEIENTFGEHHHHHEHEGHALKRNVLLPTQ